MQPKLRPGQDLAEFFEGSIAAGQGDKCVGQFRHLRLSVVHGVHDDQLSDVAMRKFPCDQGFRNDADHFTAATHHRIGDRPHQTYATATVDEANATTKQRLTHSLGAVSVFPAHTGAGATEYANAS